MKIVKVRKADHYRPVAAKKRRVRVKQKDGLRKPRPAMKLVGVKVKACDAVKVKIDWSDLAEYTMKSSMPGVQYKTEAFFFGGEDRDKQTYRKQLDRLRQEGPFVTVNRGVTYITLKEMEDIQRNGEKSNVFQNRYNLSKKDFLIAVAPKIISELKNMQAEVLQRIEKDYDKYQARFVTSVITQPGNYDGLSGSISFGDVNATFKNATFTLKKNGDIIWKKGEWLNGTWKNGIFKKGYWENGTWKNGTFEDGTWKNGTFENGKFKGEWDGGNWKGGAFNGLWSGGSVNGKPSVTGPERGKL